MRFKVKSIEEEQSSVLGKSCNIMHGYGEPGMARYIHDLGKSLEKCVLEKY